MLCQKSIVMYDWILALRARQSGEIASRFSAGAMSMDLHPGIFRIYSVRGVRLAPKECYPLTRFSRLLDDSPVWPYTYLVV
jgi:hypothetical protein